MGVKMVVDFERAWVLDAFPNCRPEDFKIIGKSSWQYNCYGYAWNEPFWYSDGNDDTDLMLDAAEDNRYELVWDLDAPPVPGRRRVVYYMLNRQIRHAAVQQVDGSWISKLGSGPLVHHRNLECLSCDLYGVPGLMFEERDEWNENGG